MIRPVIDIVLSLNATIQVHFTTSQMEYRKYLKRCVSCHAVLILSQRLTVFHEHSIFPRTKLLMFPPAELIASSGSEAGVVAGTRAQA